MITTKGKMENGSLVISLEGQIDSTNAPIVDAEIQKLRDANPTESIVLDLEKLEYTTSAGLRVILHTKQEVDDTVLINASTEVYNILDMTGFTEMMEVRKAYRVFSVEGCEVIGQGANGKVYRISDDTIVKVYRNPDALPEIQRERELARTAFVAGVPTAIPYDVVRIKDGGYGSVFEMLNAISFAKLLIRKEKTLDEVAKMSVELLKLIHSKTVKPDAMPDMKQVALEWIDSLKDHLPEGQYEKLHSLVEGVPDDPHMMHGDYHIKNIMLQDGEALLIDMDTLCFGHPVFELASMFNAYKGYSEVDHTEVETFLGISYDMACTLWEKSLKLYLGTEDEARIREVEDKARTIGYTRIMRRMIRQGNTEKEYESAMIEHCRKELAELLPRVDTLLF
jgi:uncharacterized protein (TIGR02172 family)